MATADLLLCTLKPVLSHLATLPLEETLDPAAVAGQLNATYPLAGTVMSSVRRQLQDGLDAGWLCPRQAGDVRFGRLAKATPDTHNFSIDAVEMVGPGPGHTHPQGELDLCFALDGDPRFDGRPAGWTVYGPESWHVPTVTGGRMVILYFLPAGQIQFGPRPKG